VSVPIERLWAGWRGEYLDAPEARHTVPPDVAREAVGWFAPAPG
jgi:hypothetical protein